MSPRTPEQFKHIRKEKKALIMEAALELLANDGYYASSISKIAEKAGVSKGLMYNYFESKDALVLELLSKGIDEMLEYFDPNNDGILTEAEMESFIRNIFMLLKKDIKYWKLYYALFLQPQAFKLIQDKYTNLVPAFIGILTRYYEAHNSKDPVNEALLFGAMMDGVGFNYVMNPSLYPIDNLIDTILEKFCYIKNNKNEKT